MKKLGTFSVRFIARASKNTQNSNERLYARITVAGERTEVSLGQDIASGLFDQNVQRCLKSSKEARLANDFMETVKYKLNDYRKELMLGGNEVSADSLKRKYMGIPLTGEIQKPTIMEPYGQLLAGGTSVQD